MSLSASTTIPTGYSTILSIIPLQIRAKALTALPLVGALAGLWLNKRSGIGEDNVQGQMTDSDEQGGEWIKARQFSLLVYGRGLCVICPLHDLSVLQYRCGVCLVWLAGL